jgi:hypothetical protein
MGDEEKTVWIKCRASEKCEGQKAVIKFAKEVSGPFDSDTGGRLVRYQCCTCGQSFHIRQ